MAQTHGTFGNTENAAEVELYGLPYSPWSEKARWALDARNVAYESRTYQPLIGEPSLRARLKKWRGPVTVPVLVTPGKAIGDSFEIARYADARGSGPRLFPPGKETTIAEYNDLSERGLSAGRALSLPQMLADRDALNELVPRAIKARLGRFSPALAAFGIRRTMRKYGSRRQSRDLQERTLVEVLDRLRDALAKSTSQSEPRTLLAEFSYADIAMAQVLAFANPPATGLKLGAGSRRAFSLPDIASRYADLIAWRDAIYAKYRHRS
jgi:glutathione S-transferase